VLRDAAPPARPRPTAQDRLTAVLAAIGEGLLVLDPRRRIRLGNRAARRLLDCPDMRLLGRDVLDLIHPDAPGGPELLVRLFNRVAAGEEYASCETRMRVGRAGGIDVGVVLTPLRTDDRRDCVVLVFRDISERRRHEQQLRDSETRFRTTFEVAPVGVVLIAPDGTVAAANPAIGRILGHPPAELVGRRPLEFWHDDEVDRERLSARLDAGEIDGYEVDRRLRHRDGSTVHTRIAVAALPRDSLPRSCVSVVRDVTEHRRLELELRHAQKLEAVGRLAAGVAHEINTPIQFVGDNVGFLGEAFAAVRGVLAAYRELAPGLPAADRRRLADAEAAGDISWYEQEVPAAVEQTRDGVDRVATIVRAMRDFGHPGGPDRLPSDLNAAIQATATVARNEYKWVADLDLDLDPLPPVPCHLSDVNQVLLNLLVNAAHAIGDVVGDSGRRGLIMIRTRAEPDAVAVTVSDTGTGIPQELRAKVFEPFFTTKPVGRGTGQGLALVYSVVVDRHGGTLALDSTDDPGAGPTGTTITFRLPLHPDPKDPG
jgi:PAS domain S-box-containing protein